MITVTGTWHGQNFTVGVDLYAVTIVVLWTALVWTRARR